MAYNTRWLVEPVEKFIGRKLEYIHLVGGGGNSKIWCQIFADILDMPVRQMKDPIQANARGAGLIAAAGLGEIQIGDAARLVTVQQEFEPEAHNRVLYQERYAVFTQIYRQMHRIYERLNP